MKVGKNNSDFARITWTNLKKLLNLFNRFGGLQRSSVVHSKTTSEFSRKYSRKKTTGFQMSGWLKLLSVLPWLLVLIFLVSFFWDFKNINLTLYQSAYELEGLLRIVSVSGLIGFLTNWVAIAMLFRPSKKRPLLGHGLIPAQKEQIANRLAAAVHDDLINPAIILKNIRDSGAVNLYRKKATTHLKMVIDTPEFRIELKEWIVNYFRDLVQDEGIRNKIALGIHRDILNALGTRPIESLALKAYTLLKGRDIHHMIDTSLRQLPDSIENELEIVDDLLNKMPELIENESEKIETEVTKLVHKLVNQLNVYALVEESLKKYNEEKLETLIRGATNEQLFYIQYLGAMLGTIGGFVIWQPLLSLAILSLLGLSILLTDKFLFSYMSSTKEIEEM